MCDQKFLLILLCIVWYFIFHMTCTTSHTPMIILKTGKKTTLYISYHENIWENILERAASNGKTHTKINLSHSSLLGAKSHSNKELHAYGWEVHTRFWLLFLENILKTDLNAICFLVHLVGEENLWTGKLYRCMLTNNKWVARKTQ